MVVFGGLMPIASRLFLDILALGSLFYCTFSSTKTTTNGLVLIGTCLLTLTTAGMTCRWTLTFPMIPIVVLQVMRRLEIFSGGWTSISIAILTTLLILVAALLSILFPAVQLPPIKGEYNVGIVKLHLPVNFASVYNDASGDEPDGFVTARIMYPTLEEPKSLPYLDPDTALDFCKETISFGAPPPLNQFGWILHNWRLIQMPLSPNAKPLEGNDLPLVVYSHGLGGNAISYTYQTQHLAAQGYVVLVLDHTDGSAPVVQRRDGTNKLFDYTVGQIAAAGKQVEYVRERRSRTDYRVKEFIASATSLIMLNKRNIPQLESVGVSFVNKLNTNDLHFMGHSFGAATVLTAAVRRPDLVSSVIAHEPASDWMPDDARRSLFPEHRVAGALDDFSGWTGGYETDQEEEKKDARSISSQTSIHDIPMLFLYSDEWKEKKWGGVDLIEYMHQNGELGTKNGLSSFGVIRDARHNEFSDVCMMTPLWLARSVGVTGKRHPQDTAEEIKERTLDFLSTVRTQKRCS